MRQAILIALTAPACLIAAQAVVATGPVPLVFTNQTATRMVSDPSLGVSDIDEKDYAWGDVDHDGDIDLVVVRKQPFTSTGKRPNVLFMNVKGVLTDQTAQYASTAINLPKGVTDAGFLTPTNDRDVILIDVDGDGWLDIVTAVTLSDGDPKHIGHPRVYMNLGSVNGVWQGFVFDNARIPQMLSNPVGGTPIVCNPRFNCVTGGDLTGDGMPELYFGDHDDSAFGAPLEPANADFNQKLLLNDGHGYFTDVTTLRMPQQVMWESAFSASAAYGDLNGDGRYDIVRTNALAPSNSMTVIYQSPFIPGFFNNVNAILGASSGPYFVTIADLNNDGRLDLIETDDILDSYLLNTGNTGIPPLQVAAFTTLNFPSGTGSFGGQNIAADLNGDNFPDVLIADVHDDTPGCFRFAEILRNNANPPNVTFTHDTGNIPAPLLVGVHYFGVFDINGDGWLDLVIGRCTGTQVWIFVPPVVSVTGDLNGDGIVNSLDLGILLSAWSIPARAPGCGGSAPCPADINGDGFVNSLDLGILLANWTL